MFNVSQVKNRVDHVLQTMTECIVVHTEVILGEDYSETGGRNLPPHLESSVLNVAMLPVCTAFTSFACHHHAVLCVFRHPV